MERAQGFVRLTLAGLAARILFLLLEPAARLVGDEHTWTAWGQDVASAAVWFSPTATRLIFYPPVYPYFIAAPLALFGSFTAVQWCQVLASALLVPAVGRVGAATFGARAGTLAAAFAAFYPDLIWYSTHFWSESVFLVLLWWAFERLIVADRDGDRAVALSAGLLYGLAILTRETALYFAPLAALWLASGRPRAIGRGAAFVLAAFLVVAPWTYRNYVVYDAFVPVSTAGGLNLWQGNARLSREEVYALYAQVPGRIEKYRHAQRAGLAAIAERQPAWLFEKLTAELPRFWEADSLALAHIRRGAYGVVTTAAYRVAAVVLVAPYLALLALFVAGVARARFDRRVLLLLGFLAYYTLLHVATHGFARYRLPIVPVLFAFAASAVALWRAGEWRALDARRRTLAVVLALTLGVSVAVGFAERPAAEEAPPP
jgi:4-amino-4-deoxy-L-arabinose transferase-like glycosyltransferase